MKKPGTPRRSSLGLIVLWQLFEGPMHVYRVQKMIEAQGKDRVVNVRSRASLYQTIERLHRHGLVEWFATGRADRYPDRVVYEITDAGRAVARQWLREMLHTTEGEYPEFIAALSILFGLPPDDARAELELRTERLQDALAASEQELASAPPGLPRLFLLEEEYRKAMLEAEIGWLRGLIEDLREGRLTWSEEWLRELAATFLPADGDDQQHEEDE
ncbi:MAG TPA: PadR family transcriptional regulator [Solirubrobacteraceae bacterium]|nr:PadR family transcriptional regulator [Solirubrobacteraceae bacterium]